MDYQTAFQISFITFGMLLSGLRDVLKGKPYHTDSQKTSLAWYQEKLLLNNALKSDLY